MSVRANYAERGSRPLNLRLGQYNTWYSVLRTYMERTPQELHDSPSGAERNTLKTPGTRKKGSEKEKIEKEKKKKGKREIYNEYGAMCMPIAMMQRLGCTECTC